MMQDGVKIVTMEGEYETAPTQAFEWYQFE